MFSHLNFVTSRSTTAVFARNQPLSRGRARGRRDFYLRLPALFLTVFLFACASTPLSPQRPEVSVVNVTPVSLSGNEQRFLFTLRLDNPNAFALPVEGVDLTATFAGEQIAVGRSTTEVSVPANGEAELGIEITTQLKNLLGNFLKNIGSGNLNLDYQLAGDIKIKNLATPFPFKSSGNLLDAGE